MRWHQIKDLWPKHTNIPLLFYVARFAPFISYTFELQTPKKTRQFSTNQEIVVRTYHVDGITLPKRAEVEIFVGLSIPNLIR